MKRHSSLLTSYIQNPKIYFLITVLLLLSGCASRPLTSHDERVALWERHRNSLGDIDNWFLKGRIAIQLEKEGWSASLHWRQAQQNYLLRLIAPLGRGTFELNGDNQHVSLKTAENELIQAKDPESLLQDTLGWHVPVSGLVYWIRGLPQPDVSIKTLSLDEKGRLNQLEQGEWRVTYRSYLGEDGYDLPGKMSLQNHHLKVRFSIKQWDIPL